MSSLYAAVAVLSLFAGPGPAGAEFSKKAENPRAWAERVQKAYEGVKDLKAGFTQQVTLKQGGKPGAVASGQVWIAKPGKLRWEFLKPEVKTFVSDGKTMWMYDGGENQVIVNEHMAETNSVTALNFLQGLGQLQKDFEVSLAAAPADATERTAQFLSLKPKDEGDVQLAEIVLGIDRKSALAEEVTLVDQLGNRTHISFKEISVNKGIAAKIFSFEIPKGAEVIQPAVVK